MQGQDALMEPIGWNGDDDPENPFNWPAARINIYAGLLSLLTLLTPLASSIVAPAVPTIMVEFGSTNPELEAFVVSIYILGLGLGPMIFAPLSEIYGRIIIYHVCNVGFIAFNVACALVPSLSSLIAFRFLAGFFGSCPPTNGGASIADMVPQARRGAFLAAFAVGPILGPAIGPVAGGFLSTAGGWRWVFWLVAIVSGAVELAMALVARETYAPVILQRRVDRRRRRTGEQHLRHVPDRGLSPTSIIRLSIVRPLRLLFASPIGGLAAFYTAVVYGYLYLMLSSITEVFEQSYGFSTNMASLTYLGMGAGSMLGIALVSTTTDRYVRRQMAASPDSKAPPEARIYLLPMGGALLPAGLFLYGWAAEYHVHWIAPVIGMAIVGVGNVIIFLGIVMYLVDAFTIYAASAVAANTLFRSLGGAFLPLAGQRLFDSLGYGWGNSLLGFIAVAILPVPFAFRRYGEYLRKRWPVKDL